MSHLQAAQERVCAVDCKWSDWGDWEGRAQVLMVDHQQHSTRKSEKSVEHDYFVQNCTFFFFLPIHLKKGSHSRNDTGHQAVPSPVALALRRDTERMPKSKTPSGRIAGGPRVR